jgi:multidrug transporter EmrE-like cation transporter
MSEQTWSFVILAAEIVGLAAMRFLIGQRRLWWGWLVVVACVSLPWLAYSISTWKVGFVVLSLLWLCVHLSNAFTWKKGCDVA